MTTITDYISTNVKGVLVPVANIWVRLNNNSTLVDYVSTTATDVNGKFTINNLPAGTYTVFTGPAVDNTPNGTGNANYSVEPVDASGNAAIPGTLIVTGTTTLTGGFAGSIEGGVIVPAAGQVQGVGSGPGPGVFFGSGAPTVTAPKGSLYLRTDGTTTNDRMFVNTNGTTTWTAVTTTA